MQPSILIPNESPSALSDAVRKCFEHEVENVKQSPVLQPGASASTWEGYLGAVVDHISATRSFFMDDARQFVTLVLVLFVASGILAAQAAAADTPSAESLIMFIAALAIVASIFPITDALKWKARAAYELYVASAIHAAIIHSAVSLGNTHQWFSHVYRNIDEIQNSDSEWIRNFDVTRHWKQVLIHRWMRSSSALKAGHGNLLQSFNRLLLWSRIAAVVALILGSVFVSYHLSSATAGQVSPTAGQQMQSETQRTKR